MGSQQVGPTFLINKCSNNKYWSGLTHVDSRDGGIIQFDTDACFVRSLQENRITVKVLGNEKESFWRYFSNHDVVSYEGDMYFFIIIEQNVKQHIFKVDKV